MNREQIMDAIRQLAESQGYYGRFLQHLQTMQEEEPERFDYTMGVLEEQNFKDTLDLVLFLET